MLQQPGQEQSQRFRWVLLIIIASLGFIYFYVIPFLSASGVGSGGSASSGEWSDTRQRQIAFDLAQNVQTY